MLAMIGDAISDPLVGIVPIVALATRPKASLLIAAPLPLALSLYFVFNPPQWLFDLSSETAIFAWLATGTIISRSVLTLFNVPHLALGR
ncbi:MAG: hypothetical protein CM15mP120_15660 [Pseudomonadota bacterium]|nr:MAG: hypothetical protein CM15mP120_15660 [Pseudomonadota bacterium]